MDADPTSIDMRGGGHPVSSRSTEVIVTGRPTKTGLKVLSAFDPVDGGHMPEWLTMSQIEVRGGVRPPASYAAVRRLIANGHLTKRMDHGGMLYRRITETGRE